MFKSMGLHLQQRSKQMIRLSDGTKLYFGRGKFDDWCIYVEKRDGTIDYPLDSWYFDELQKLNYGKEIYNDFCLIYDITTKNLSSIVAMVCKSLAVNHKDWQLLELIYSILYMGMIAEENKENTILGKRIKRLGMHQTLIENVPAEISANYSRGMKWTQLDEECSKRGF
jgi:hypothetical protein